MIAAALALGATVERAIPILPTLSERFHLLCVMERYASAARLPTPDAVMHERLAANEELARIIVSVAARACEEMMR